mmetsp:Transcript_20689/g.57740  ORF Transcript_20689/g.57740 Transcript_20689/m.57740 type:complete len:226 (+) Transcript_20689:79-756(+)
MLAPALCHLRLAYRPLLRAPRPHEARQFAAPLVRPQDARGIAAPGPLPHVPSMAILVMAQDAVADASRASSAARSRGRSLVTSGLSRRVPMPLHVQFGQSCAAQRRAVATLATISQRSTAADVRKSGAIWSGTLAFGGSCTSVHPRLGRGPPRLTGITSQRRGVSTLRRTRYRMKKHRYLKNVKRIRYISAIPQYTGPVGRQTKKRAVIKDYRKMPRLRQFKRER